MIVILFAEVRVTKISATTFVNGFSTLIFYIHLFCCLFFGCKITINLRIFLSLTAKICSLSTKNMTFQQIKSLYRGVVNLS